MVILFKMILLYRYYTSFKRSLFKLLYQKEFNDSNFILIRLLKDKKIESIKKLN